MPSTCPPVLSDGDLRMVTSDSETTDERFDAAIAHVAEIQYIFLLEGDDGDDSEVHVYAVNDLRASL